MDTENSKVGFVLQGIKTEQFAIIDENFSPRKKTGLGTELQFKLDQKNKQIGVYIDFEFIQTRKVFLKIQVSCHFKIEQKSWDSLYQENQYKLVIPKDFLAHLAMITTGTARGVLFAKTESTQFSAFIIPTLNVADMISEDAVFNMSMQHISD